MTTLVAGEKIITENVTFEEYLQQYSGQQVEYDNGRVIEASPSTGKHNDVITFLIILFETYLQATNEGKMHHEKITMRLVIDGKIKGPEPDLFVVTTPNLHKLTETYLDGAADLVVEVISSDSDNRDRVKKFMYYETSGVREYWIIDPNFNETLFYVLDENGQFQRQAPNDEGFYQSSVLSRMKLRASLLLQYPSPGFRETGRIIDEMLGL